MNEVHRDVESDFLTCGNGVAAGGYSGDEVRAVVGGHRKIDGVAKRFDDVDADAERRVAGAVERKHLRSDAEDDGLAEVLRERSGTRGV